MVYSEEAYREGYNAGYAGLSRYSNPYRNSTPEYDDWDDGYDDGSWSREDDLTMKGGE